MDWNNDGKEDWQDAVIYHDIIDPVAEEERNKQIKHNDTYQSNIHVGKILFALLCVAYFILTLINN